MSEWRGCTLKDIAYIEYGKSPKDVKVEYSDIPIFGTSGQVGYAVKTLFEGPLVMIGRKGTINKPLLIEGGCWIIDTAYAAKPKQDVDVQWLYYCLIYSKLEKLNEATGVPSLNRENLYNLKLTVPPVKEQQKIASILASVDEAIEKTEAIIQQTEEVKKGLIQQLLTKGIGHTKFKKTAVGEIPEEWELLSIGSIAKLQGGYAFKSKDYLTEGMQLIRISNLFGKFLNLAKDPVYLPPSYKEDYEGYVLKGGDLIICMTGTVGKEDYGHVVKIPQDSKPLLLNQRVGRFILQTQGVDRNFLYWFLSSRLFLDVIYSFGNGTKQANLSAKQIESVLIPLPSKEEQMKISEVLDSIDKKVEIEKDKLCQIREIKQGLMQSLLTGKVRVKVDEVEVTQV